MAEVMAAQTPAPPPPPSQGAALTGFSSVSIPIAMVDVAAAVSATAGPSNYASTSKASLGSGGVGNGVSSVHDHPHLISSHAKQSSPSQHHLSPAQHNGPLSAQSHDNQYRESHQPQMSPHLVYRQPALLHPDGFHSNSPSPSPASNGALGSTSGPSPSSAISQSRRGSATAVAPQSMPTTAADLMREGPRDFTVIKDVGDGSFGTVCLADWHSPLPSGTMLSPMQHPTTRPEYIGKRLVAIKKMKEPLPNWEACIRLKELRSLLAIPHHPNIIPLYDAFLMPTTKNLHFVFECMEGNLYQLTKSRKGRPLAGGLVASIFQQIVHGLHHIHEHGYFHRDMKPENLLITTTGIADYPASSAFAMSNGSAEKDVLVIVKLADFGLARETASKPPYTEYVSTRWYRAPEVLLRSRDYSNPVDLWAFGTIMAELVNLKPLFPGQSEVDQVLQVCDVLGDPTNSYGADERGRVRGGGEWAHGVKMAWAVGFSFPKVPPVRFNSLFGSKVPRSLIDCIQDLLRWNPKARLTTKDCLNHPYFVQDAPLLQPPQARALSSGKVQHVDAPMSIGGTLGIEAGGATRPLPASHAESTSVNAPPKPAFGAGNPNMKALPALRAFALAQQSKAAATAAAAAAAAGSLPSGVNGHSVAASRAAPNQAQRVPFYPSSVPSASAPDGMQVEVASPQAQRRGSETLNAPPEKAFMSNGVSPVAFKNQNHAQTVYDVDMTIPPEQVVSQQAALRSAASGPKSSPQRYNQTLPATEKTRKWGLGSVFGAAGVNASSASASNDPAQRPPLPTGQPTPAQQIIADHAAAQARAAAAAKPLNPKQAKKEAEKAAREAEKLKRAAQEKAARDRARAVLAKRNAFSAAAKPTTQAVEFIPVGTDGTAFAITPAGSSGEKGKGKQGPPANTIIVPSAPVFGKPTIVNSAGAGLGLLPSGGPGFTSAAWQPRPNFYSSVNTVQLNGRHKARRREFDDDHSTSSYGDESIDQAYHPNLLVRRTSMQSYLTGESDPGPSRPPHATSTASLPRVGTSSSLGSAPTPVESKPGRLGNFDAGSFDSRSVNASLDHSLIANMERMTAAEARQRTPGGVPASASSSIPRQSASRQSRASVASRDHRQGSASPLHHTNLPRYHPYPSHVPSSSHSHFGGGVTLPPIHQEIEDGVGVPAGLPQSVASRSFHSLHGYGGVGPASRDSLTSPISADFPPIASPNGGGSGGSGGGHSSASGSYGLNHSQQQSHGIPQQYSGHGQQPYPPQHHQQVQHALGKPSPPLAHPGSINPMFQVPDYSQKSMHLNYADIAPPGFPPSHSVHLGRDDSNATGALPTLPSFSEFAAVADQQHPRSSGPHG